ncbi:MAG: glycosyltransferase [Acetatifactor sp.]|nr:glycosyltransferase [Acetatifactor sp.]
MRRNILKIDVVIPLYKPGKELFTLLDQLNAQTLQISNIILMNTEEKYFLQLTEGMDFAKAYPNAQVHHLKKEDFDHGATRHQGMMLSNADVVVCMTQDAMPADEYLIEKLTARLGGDVAVAYARQLPSSQSSEAEKISRAFNYPDTSCLKRAEDIPTLGIKTFFCSNVCAAYRKDIYEKQGGFIRHTIFNEDMIFASGVVRSGMTIAYEAEAKVVHSHNYSCMQQLHRNFDLGVSQADHPEVFGDVPSESEGMKLVKATWKAMKESGRIYLFPAFCMQCAFKLAGYKLGKSYRKLPRKWVLALSDNKAYWK